jgi:hypothetical protein
MQLQHISLPFRKYDEIFKRWEVLDVRYSSILTSNPQSEIGPNQSIQV